MTIQFQKFIVPIDFSNHSRQALNFATELAGGLGAEVELVHVLESSPYEVYQKSGFIHSVPIYERTATALPRAAQNYIIHDVMEETRDQLICMVSEKMNYRVQVRHGHVVDELLGEITTYAPDLVVMCTHGWSGLRHLVLGSVVEKIVRLSPVPVLTIRAAGG